MNEFGAEIETPVGKTAVSAGNRAAFGGAVGDSRKRDRPGPDPAPSGELTLVNADREFVERKGDGQFVARPLFDRKIASLFYGVRDADTGDWITACTASGAARRAQRRLGILLGVPGKLDEQPDLDKDRAYLLVMLAAAEDGKRGEFYAVIPFHEPGRIWDKILVRPQPRALGQGLRRLADRGRPRHPLRRRGAGVGRGRRQLRGDSR